MKIAPGKSAKLAYTLFSASDKKIIEKVEASKPVTFKFGANELIEGFEKKLYGLRAGDEFDFIITAEKAYGPVDPYAIFDIPKDTFEVDGEIDEKMLSVGNVVPMTDNEGNKHLGKIIKVLEETIGMDFNHPLAGKDLQFKGIVIEVVENHN